MDGMTLRQLQAHVDNIARLEAQEALREVDIVGFAHWTPESREEMLAHWRKVAGYGEPEPKVELTRVSVAEFKREQQAMVKRRK